jgi:tryptophanyl-tRNA synthetase
MKKSELQQLIREEISKVSKDRSDIKGTEDAKRAEWKSRYGSMDGFDKTYPQYSKKNIKEETNTGLITFEQLKQSCIESYKEYLEEYDSDEDEAVMESFDEVVNMEELLDLLDGMGFNGNEAYDFIFDSILK